MCVYVYSDVHADWSRGTRRTWLALENLKTSDFLYNCHISFNVSERSCARAEEPDSSLKTQKRLISCTPATSRSTYLNALALERKNLTRPWKRKNVWFPVHLPVMCLHDKRYHTHKHKHKHANTHKQWQMLDEDWRRWSERRDNSNLSYILHTRIRVSQIYQKLDNLTKSSPVCASDNEPSACCFLHEM